MLSQEGPLWIVASRENIIGVGAILPKILTSTRVDIVVMWVVLSEKNV